MDSYTSLSVNSKCSEIFYTVKSTLYYIDFTYLHKRNMSFSILFIITQNYNQIYWCVHISLKLIMKFCCGVGNGLFDRFFWVSSSKKPIHFYCYPLLLLVLSLPHLHYLWLFLLFLVFLLLIYLLPPRLFCLLLLDGSFLRFIWLLGTLFLLHIQRKLFAQSREHLVDFLLICHWLWFSLAHNILQIGLFLVRFFSNHQFREIAFVFKTIVRFGSKSNWLIFLLDFLQLLFHFPFFL
jgi:hypothetical protein